ncbi:MAG: FAD-binding oxidoreductase [Gemmatimonadota bacterium]
MTRSAEVVICGAGIIGVAAAHALAVTHGIRDVVLVDEGTPLSLTSDKSTEAYRNWWPGPDDAMVRFMNRSIDLLEQYADASGNRFLMNRRGYLYATANAETAARYLTDGALAEQQGAGALRVYRDEQDARAYVPSTHVGFHDHPTGADLFLDASLVRERFPWLAPDIIAVLHARRCGWLSGQQLGAHLLDEARAAGVQTLHGCVTDVEVLGNHVRGVTVAMRDGTSERIATDCFVNAAGPHAARVSRLVGVALPLFSELHLKVSIEDTARVVDRDTGLVILDDPQSLVWTDDEREELRASDETRWMTEPMPAGVHLRPEGYHGSSTVLMLWDYHSAQRYDDAHFPLPEDPFYPEVVLRGMTRLAPGLQQYVDRIPRNIVDGGYYTKTAENRPLVGPLPVGGAFVSAGFSGYGLMAAPAAGELVAAHVTGAAMPAYAPAFSVTRYESEDYRRRVEAWSATGQL